MSVYRHTHTHTLTAATVILTCSLTQTYNCVPFPMLLKTLSILVCFISLSPRPKRLTLKGYKQFWFTFNNTSISYYKSKEESLTEPIQQMNLKGHMY